MSLSGSRLQRRFPLSHRASSDPPQTPRDAHGSFHEFHRLETSELANLANDSEEARARPGVTRSIVEASCIGVDDGT